MCVAATARRRRRQMKIDKRYKRRDPIAAARDAAKKLAEERARANRKAAKK